MYAVLLLIAGLPNFDFTSGNFKHWEGSGFALEKGVVSSKAAAKHPAILHRTFTIPANALTIEFQAAVVRPAGMKPGELLDVWLEAAKREYLPRQVWEGGKWVKSDDALPGGMRTYAWRVDGHRGQRVRVAIADLDARPGCYVVCSGFRVVTLDEANVQAFERDLRAVEKKAGVAKSRRYDSRHFLAYGNAGLSFTDARLEDCELMYSSFFRHFRKRGFAVREPAEKMMVAVFRKQSDFEAFLGLRLGPSVTGVYHPPTNRLVVYDYATNASFVKAKEDAEEAVGRVPSAAVRSGLGLALGRAARDRRDDVNVSTLMHEAAHQLSFNSGLLNRKGDVPAWLAEGLAMYCEPSIKGAWQGIGGANPMRAALLARAKKFFKVRDLVVNDDWLRKARRVEDVVLGYSQSWALFRMLMEENPRQMREYLKAVHARRGPEHRLADFAAAFGGIKRLEERHEGYLRAMASAEGGGR